MRLVRDGGFRGVALGRALSECRRRVAQNKREGHRDTQCAISHFQTSPEIPIRAGYFTGAAASLSNVLKLSSSSQNCSTKLHFGLNPNSMRVVQGLVYALASSMVMSSTR